MKDLDAALNKVAEYLKDLSFRYDQRVDLILGIEGTDVDSFQL
jgi:hypothetical protein